MQAIFFFLALLPTIAVQQDTDTLTIDQQLHVTISGQYPPTYQPDFHAFFQSIDEKDFILKDKQITSKEGMFSIACTLQPTATGKLTWAPGILDLHTKKHYISILVSPIQVVCIPSILASVPYADLLPLYPSQAIPISGTNEIASFDNHERLAIEQQRNQRIFSRHQKAWVTFAILLLACTALPIVLWALIQYDILTKKGLAITPQEEFAKVYKIANDAALPLSQRWGLLAYLIRLALGVLHDRDLKAKDSDELLAVVAESNALNARDKGTVCTAIQRLVTIEFANIPSSEEEWQQSWQTLNKLFETVS